MHTLEEIYQKVEQLGQVQMLSDTSTVVQAGYYAQTTLQSVDPDLVASEKETPILLDAMVLRPLGLVLTAVGAAAFVIPGAFTMMTRPTDIGKPFKVLVGNQFRYTFMDPLGAH